MLFFILIAVLHVVSIFELTCVHVLSATDAGQKRRKEDMPVFEQAENVDNPLRCPVKLYEFYLSKWLVYYCGTMYICYCLTYYLYTVSPKNFSVLFL